MKPFLVKNQNTVSLTKGVILNNSSKKGVMSKDSQKPSTSNLSLGGNTSKPMKIMKSAKPKNTFGFNIPKDKIKN